MSKHNNRRNSNSNLGDQKTKRIKTIFSKNATFDERLNIIFEQSNEPESFKSLKCEVLIEAPAKVLKAVCVNPNGIEMKNKQYLDKEITIKVNRLLV